jgi:outer membrane immunogenic protein
VTLGATVLPAAAADYPIAPIYEPRPVAVIFRWTGVYIGLHAGFAHGFVDENVVPFGFPVAPGANAPVVPLPTSLGVNGGFLGGQLGANWQIESWVIGAEAQASWAPLSGSSTCAANEIFAPTPAIVANCTAKMDALGTAAVRLGWAFDHLLLYGKGGAAWTNNNYKVNFSLTTNGTTLSQLLFSVNELRWGWMVGLGVEYAFTDNWSAKIEYNYMDFGADSLQFTDTTGDASMGVNLRERLHLLKIGINYRFGAPPLLVR